MAESVIFSFTKIDDFFEVMIDTDGIETSLFDGVTPNFRIVLAESCPDNIDECLDENNKLDDTNMVLIKSDSTDGQCALAWNKGVNANRNIQMSSNTVVYDLDDGSYAVKGAFLVVDAYNTEGSADGTVLAYSINNAPILCKKQIIMPIDGVVWYIYSKLYEQVE